MCFSFLRNDARKIKLSLNAFYNCTESGTYITVRVTSPANTKYYCCFIRIRMYSKTEKKFITEHGRTIIIIMFNNRIPKH